MDLNDRMLVVVLRLQARLLECVSDRAPAQSTVEYALVGALVVIAAAGALTLLGDQLTTVFGNITRALGPAGGGKP
jgi:Flp pilus assembly pilin Flp